MSLADKAREIHTAAAAISGCTHCGVERGKLCLTPSGKKSKFAHEPRMKNFQEVELTRGRS